MKRLIILCCLIVLLSSCDKTKETQEAINYLSFESGGENYEIFVTRHFNSYNATNGSTGCNVDSCVMHAIYEVDNMIGTKLSFELMDRVDSADVVSVGNLYSYKDLTAFTRSINEGFLPYCNDTVFPCIRVHASLKNGPTWTTDQGWGNSSLGINGEVKNNLQITSIRKLNREDILESDELYFQTITLSSSNHFLYFEATFSIKFRNLAGDSLVIDNGYGKFLFVN